MRFHRLLELLLSASVVDLKLLDSLLHLLLLEFFLPLDQLHLEFAGRRLTLDLFDDALHLMGEVQATGNLSNRMLRCPLKDLNYTGGWASALGALRRLRGFDCLNRCLGRSERRLGWVLVRLHCDR